MSAPGDAPRRPPRGPLRWCFEDRGTGKIVVAQMPNLPMWIFLAAFAVKFLLHPAGRLGLAVEVIGAIGLVWWGSDELIRGVNPWRRLLGAGALAYVVVELVLVLRG